MLGEPVGAPTWVDMLRLLVKGRTHPASAGSCCINPAWKGNLAGVVMKLQMGPQGSPAFQILPTAPVPPAGKVLSGSNLPLWPSTPPVKDK